MASLLGATADSVCFEEHPDYDLHILFRENGLGGESRSEATDTFALDTAASYEDVEAPAEKRSWLMLPDEILDKIVTQAPLPAQGRCRCVCREWVRILLSPLLPYWKQIAPPYTIMTRFGEDEARFFCHFEEKWFRLPYPSWETILSWQLLDTDGGLLCYRYHWSSEERSWLSVCNPLTHSTRVILANFKLPRRLKLLVDRESKTFKVIAANDFPVLTSIYDSTTASWHVCSGFPRIWYEKLELFVWKNIIYGYEIHQEHFLRNHVARFSMESGKWTLMEEAFPCETGYRMSRYILSGKDQVMLIQFGYIGRTNNPYFSVWKLLGDGSNGSQVSLSMWEKVHIESGMVMENLASRHLSCVCYGTEYICLLFLGDRKNKRQSRDGLKACHMGHKCLRYSFVTEEWSDMPFPTGWKRGSRLHCWEPSLDINPGMDTFQDPFKEDVRMVELNFFE